MKDRGTASQPQVGRQTVSTDRATRSTRVGRARQPASHFQVKDFVSVDGKNQEGYPASLRPLPADSDPDPNQSSFSLPEKPTRPLRQRLMRNGRAKVYRLKGYTSVASVKRIRHRQEARMQKLRLIIGLTVLGILIILLIIWNPWSTLAELFRAIGF